MSFLWMGGEKEEVGHPLPCLLSSPAGRKKRRVVGAIGHKRKEEKARRSQSHQGKKVGAVSSGELEDRGRWKDHLGSSPARKRKKKRNLSVTEGRGSEKRGKKKATRPPKEDGLLARPDKDRKCG